MHKVVANAPACQHGAMALKCLSMQQSHCEAGAGCAIRAVSPFRRDARLGLSASQKHLSPVQ